MSPEQALADPLDIDIRTDVYALGVILHELLSGQLPYPISKKIHETIQTIREQEPARLSAVDRSYRGDIETIVAKALEKDRALRYASAAELAADIRRHLNDEPIVARRQSPGYQLKKFARRHKAVVGSVAAIFAVLSAAVVTSRLQALRASAAERTASAAERTALEELSHARIAEEESDRQRDIATRAEEKALKELHRITWFSLARESARLSESRTDDELAALLARQSWLMHARTPGQSRRFVEEALQQAARLSPRNRVLWRHDGPVYSVAISSDGARVASGSQDGTLRFVELNNPNAKPVVISNDGDTVKKVAFSRDGTRLAFGNKTVRILDPNKPEDPLWSPMVPVAGFLGGLAFSRDGTSLAFSDLKGLWLWDYRTPGIPPASLSEFDFSSIAFSPDGIHLAAAEQVIGFCCDDGRTAVHGGGVLLWDLRSRTPPTRLSIPTLAYNLAFSHDGVRLAYVGEDREWAAQIFAGPGGGERFDSQIWLLDISDPSSAPVKLPGQESRASDMAFSGDGRFLASAGSDGWVRLWELSRPGALPLLLGRHEGAIRSVAFSRDGQRLVSGGNDHTVRVWDLRDFTASPEPPQVHGGSVESLAFSLDSTYLASGSADRTVRVWNFRSLEVAPISLQHEDTVKSLAFSPTGTKLAGSTTGSARVWNLRDPDSAPVLLRDHNGFQSISFSADSKTLASFTSFDKSALENLNRRGAAPPYTASELAVLKRWDLHIGVSDSVFQDEKMRRLWRHEKDGPVALSKDWSRLASGLGRFIWVWDLLQRDRPPLKFRGHTPLVRALAFAPNGNRLASSGADDLTVRVWDLEKPAADPLVLPASGDNTFLALSMGGTRVVAGGGGAADVRIWDLHEPEAPPIVFRAGKAIIRSVAISDDGGYLAVGDAKGSVWLWRLWTAAANYLCTRVSRNLSLEEWRFYVGEYIPYERTCPALPAGIGVP
jgi:WD40 repeat protein